MLHSGWFKPPRTSLVLATILVAVKRFIETEMDPPKLIGNGHEGWSHWWISTHWNSRWRHVFFSYLKASVESYCAVSAWRLFDGSWDLFPSSIIISLYVEIHPLPLFLLLKTNSLNSSSVGISVIWNYNNNAGNTYTLMHRYIALKSWKACNNIKEQQN